MIDEIEGAGYGASNLDICARLMDGTIFVISERLRNKVSWSTR